MCTAGRRKRRQTYPELDSGRRSRLVVFEVDGRWDAEAASFLRLLALAHDHVPRTAAVEPAPALHELLADARWTSGPQPSDVPGPSVAAAWDASADCGLIRVRENVDALRDGPVPELHEVFAGAHWD